MVDLQIACDNKNLPSLAQLEQWTKLALQTPNTVAEITIRICLLYTSDAADE